MEKQITFTLKGPGGHIIGDDLRDLCQAVFGCNADQSITAEQINDMYPDLQAGETVEFKIIIEKQYTEEQLEAMPDSDGDIF